MVKFLSFCGYLYRNINMKKVIRLTENDLAKLVKRVINENKKQNMNEGLGTALLVLTGAGVFYLGRKIKQFIDKYGKYFPSAYLVAFLSKVESIEDGKENGKIVVKEDGNYTFIGIVIDGKVFDALTIDLENDSIYSGYNKQPKQSDMIIPKTLPYDADTENIEELRHAEESLVDSVLEIITKYGKKKDK